MCVGVQRKGFDPEFYLLGYQYSVLSVSHLSRLSLTVWILRCLFCFSSSLHPYGPERSGLYNKIPFHLMCIKKPACLPEWSRREAGKYRTMKATNSDPWSFIILPACVNGLPLQCVEDKLLSQSLLSKLSVVYTPIYTAPFLKRLKENKSNKEIKYTKKKPPCTSSWQLRIVLSI